MHIIPLCDLEKGESLLIEKIETGRIFRRRIFDLGFIEGTKIKCVETGFSGDPKAFLVRGAVIALRNCDSAGIMGVRI